MKNVFVYTLLAVCMLIVPYTAHAQADWKKDATAYPDQDYLKGVMNNVALQPATLKGRAELQLTQKVFDKVKDLIARNKSDKEAYDQVQEHYGLVLQGSEDAQLTGLRTKHGSSYVIVYVKRSDLRQTYAHKASVLQSQINAILARAQTAESGGELDSAAATYMSSYHLYEALKEAELIQLGTNYSFTGSEFAELVAAATGASKGSLTKSHKEVIDHVNYIQDPQIVNLSTIADFTAKQFQEQESQSGREVQRGPIKYGPVYNSPTDKEITEAIASKLGWTLVAMRGLKETAGGNTGSGGLNGIGMSSPSLKVYGAYWPDGDRITFRTALRDVTTGEFKASAVVKFQDSKRLDPENFLKPQGFEEATANRKTHTGNTGNQSTEIRSNPIGSGGVNVLVTTDKGTSPTLRAGEIVTLYVNVDQAAYLRLIYELADGKGTVLLKGNNYYIDSSKAGTYVEIGQFECVPPFGVEELFVYAQPTPFPEFKPGETYKQDGYVFLNTNTTRGLRERPKNILSITTTEK